MTAGSKASSRILISCEHGGNRIPRGYLPLFGGFEALLCSHRGYDRGALVMARELARALSAPLYAGTFSRLLIDLNRTIGHPRLYSEITRSTPATIRREILQRYYLPYRSKVEAAIAGEIDHGNRVIHIASHSFTPVLDGQVRTADIGLLYDPSRTAELELCRSWQARLKQRAPDMVVRRNYPYKGTDDGFTAYLRRRYPASAYLGIELEINQRHVMKGGRQWQALRCFVADALQDALFELQVHLLAFGDQPIHKIPCTNASNCAAATGLLK